VLVNLDPQDARPLYLQIMDEVRRAVVVGTLRAENPLPSVRELAAELVVNPRTGERRSLATAVAKRALLEARRNGVSANELVSMIQKLAAKEDE
jgi:GntR family transcriptional regulator